MENQESVTFRSAVPLQPAPFPPIIMCYGIPIAQVYEICHDVPKACASTGTCGSAKQTSELIK